VAGPRGKDPQPSEPADDRRAARGRPPTGARLADALRRALDDDPEETQRSLPLRTESAPPPALPTPPPPVSVGPAAVSAPQPSPPLAADLPLDDEDGDVDGDEVVDDALIDSPDKLYFRIGEVAQLVGVDAHVLRYWESEFRMKPRRSPSGQRLYRRSDLSKFLRIKSLLHDEGYTIAGARKVLTGALGAPTVDPARLKAALDRVRVLRRLIREIQDELELDGQS